MQLVAPGETLILSRAQLLAARFFGGTATRFIQVHCALAVTYKSDGYVPVSMTEHFQNCGLAACKTLASKARSPHASGYVLEGLGERFAPALRARPLEPDLEMIFFWCWHWH